MPLGLTVGVAKISERLALVEAMCRPRAEQNCASVESHSAGGPMTAFVRVALRQAPLPRTT
jgi:hypothetical protein